VVSDKTVERLFIYRSLLEKMQTQSQSNIYSHQIADLSGSTASQVRRDFMALGYTGNPRHGYHVDELLNSISRFMGQSNGIKIVLIGVGNLGRAILSYFSTLAPHFNTIASFDADPSKIHRLIAGVPCYPLTEIKEFLAGNKADIAAITVPASEAQVVAETACDAGIRSFVNFAPVRLRLPMQVHVEYMDIRLSFQKAAFFSGSNHLDKKQETPL